MGVIINLLRSRYYTGLCGRVTGYGSFMFSINIFKHLQFPFSVDTEKTDRAGDIYSDV